MKCLKATRLLRMVVPLVLALSATAWGQNSGLSGNLTSLQCNAGSGDATCSVPVNLGLVAGSVYAPYYSSLTVNNSAVLSTVVMSAYNAVTNNDIPAPGLGLNNSGAVLSQPTSQYTVNVQSRGAYGYGMGKGSSAQYDGGSAGTVSIDESGTVGMPGSPSPFAELPGMTMPGGFTPPQAAVLYAASVGGGAFASKSTLGQAGSGNAVMVRLEAGASVPLGTNVSGIFALSAGGEGSGWADGSKSTYSNGGAAGPVTVQVLGTIGGLRQADDAYGVYALSVGGSSGAADSKYSGRGGDAGPVSVTLESGSSITLRGEESIGALAASVGGLSWYTNPGSQNGAGNAVTVTANAGASVRTQGELAIGLAALSSGGNGNTLDAPPDTENGINTPPQTFAPAGNAGAVTVSNAGSIATLGDVAIGIAAVSSSGGRGVGQMVNDAIDQVGSTSPCSKTSGGACASGSGAGNPGTVTVSNSGAIRTDGTGAIGILALSLGGPGGIVDSKNGVLNYLGGTKTAGSGTAGNTVEVTNSGDIRTTGAMSMGIVAESIGGGGGTATGTGGVVAIGTNGGTGGQGGAVRLWTDGGSIATSGIGSFGLLMQSIGGGGGNGGNAKGLIAAVGGSGGAGGDGALVQLQWAGADWTDRTTGDFAPAVVMQSIGGGGGNGGYSRNFTLVPTPVSVVVGGSGAGAGNGGEVDVYEMPGFAAGQINTSGEQSPGLLAQSIGGGGGAGGAAQTFTSTAVFTDATSVGGAGGQGGNGGLVKIENQLAIATQGDDSDGILAQSIGGGGGHAGSALARTEGLPTFLAELPTISITTAIGGTGGSGGAGGAVWGQNDSTITTQGNGSVGILAQSIGGGGGDGGDSTAYSRALESVAPTLLVSVGLGGGGGDGGAGGSVNLANGGMNLNGTGTIDPCNGCTGSISTSGNNAAGILAQSIGGGGGLGGIGNASASGLPLGETGKSANITYALGGVCNTDATTTVCSGGGDGGSVTVNNTAGSRIETIGSGAQGILAQSIGGGGGDGGGAATAGSGDTITLGIAMGSSGGTGGNGGAVLVANGGSIETGAATSDGTTAYVSGGDADGILAQSIGGGGGVGGSSDAAANINAAYQLLALLQSPSSTFEGVAAVGGTGGTGGSGGVVQVANTGRISTLGERAYGILAQSIGGGGGVGGVVDSSANSYVGGVGQGSYSATVSVAGSGGSGGDGGAVTVASNGGSIATAGYGAIGLAAQSIGGGGGIGMDGTVNNTTSIGIGADVGGSGGAAGNGAAVNVTAGQVVTLGDDAYGVLAQSIGGSGGLASAGCSNSAGAAFQGVNATACFGNTAGLTLSTAPWNDSSTLTVDVGGGPGSAGSGNTVSVTADDAIVTGGARAFGIVAQSIGGGGGLFSASASNIAQTSLQQSTAYEPIAKAGNVTVNLTGGGSIATTGNGAWGILAQSIGGGGGFAGDPALDLAMPVSNTIGGNNAAAQAGTVNVTVSGSITTTGANAHGIVAQSIGGGGGFEDNAGNTALDTVGGGGDGFGNSIQITQNAGAVISATGAGSVAVFAQSSGATGQYSLPNDPIAVTIAGTVQGGTNAGYAGGGLGAAGVVLSGGTTEIGAENGMAANTVTIAAGGLLTTADGVAGTAILTNDGYTTVTNNGTVTGSINLGATPGPMSNTGLLNAGSVLNLSALANAGTISVGGLANLAVTTLTGSLAQTPTGRLAVDLDALAGQKADLLTVDGAASLQGTIAPYARNLLPGAYDVLTAASVTGDASAPSSLLFDWGVNNDGQTLSLAPSAHFMPSGVALDASETSLAQYLTHGWNAADPHLAPVFGYLSQVGGGAGGYKAALDSLSPEAAHALSSALIDNAGSILGASLSCPVFVDTTTLLGEDRCVWSKVTGNWTNLDRSSGTGSDAVSAVTYRIGAQKPVAPGWYLGGSLGLTDSWQSGSEGSSGNGTTFDGSMAIKRVIGPWLFAGSVAAANGSFQNNRALSLPATGTQPAVFAALTSDSDTLLLGGRLRAGYEFTFPHWYLRPYLDGDIVYAHTPGYQESGNATYALQVGGNSLTTFIATPSLEIGNRITLNPATVLRGYLTLGASLRSNDQRQVSARFLGASASDGSFTTAIDAPRVTGELALGVALYRLGGFEARAEYDVAGGSDFLSQGGTLRLAYHF